MGKRDAQYQVWDSGDGRRILLHRDPRRREGRAAEARKNCGSRLAETSEGTPKKTSDKPVVVRYIKTLVIDDLKSETIDGNVRMYVNPSSTITSDDSTSYTNMKSLVSKHVHQVIEPKQVGKLLPWVHIAISNAKRLLLDVYHDIRPAYLQSYLNEFCYKFNRSTFGDKLFDRLVVAALAYKNEFRYNNIA